MKQSILDKQRMASRRTDSQRSKDGCALNSTRTNSVRDQPDSVKNCMQVALKRYEQELGQ